MRDHKFPRPEAVSSSCTWRGKRQERRWAERKLKGFAEVQEVLGRILQERYAPRTQTLKHKSWHDHFVLLSDIHPNLP